VRSALFLPLSLGLVFGAFAAEPAADVPPPPPATIYEVKGIIREILPGGKARIAHEAIPNYMEAMTMEFSVPEAKELEGLKAGDAISFRLLVTVERGWIDQLHKIAEAPGVKPTAPPMPMATAEVGDLLPDCALVDQSGRPFHLRDFKGKALVLTFIYSRCVIPEFCPLINRRLESVQKAFSVRDAPANWTLVSVSMDPEFDTPERLTTYSAAYRPDPARWLFATGKPRDIETLGSAFGLFVQRQGQELNHNMRTVVVNPDGRIRSVFTGNDWSIEELLDEVESATAAK
jgi:protein SCO1/2